MTCWLDAQSLQLPIIDISPLAGRQGDCTTVVKQLEQACRETGFFYIVGHGIDEKLQQRLEDLSRQFFAQDLATKMQIRMALAGRAWRGYFPVGGELTSGKPDRKEGVYFGSELDADDPRVKANLLLHGKNLFPPLPDFGETVLEYLSVMTGLGHTIMEGIALSLELESSYFYDRYTANPLILFRIFNYPPDEDPHSESWGVGEHTDYGLLTILKQDDSGGLQVKTGGGWISAPPVANSFVCNIGDMLDRLTGGFYRSTPHRVRNPSPSDRLSFPFFFDPNFDAQIQPIPTRQIIQDDLYERWDKASVHQLQGTYGDYILSKVAKVFPDLRQTI
ncbi:isopenicillin N synthase family dioxygenase [Gloeothece verrucosa]|uniref:2OG-Fe(II) oxygenase n=1 Tax=Gloeothece verrucosa (strain PCC 7822) TaxID=497965 RepID=E0UMS6_GLOV7|nr:2-oxoglutarate and iron-dependent oxygenase domain-containing protein [Gloeothece verrucosa]ADN18256.1 2OG-Fe(II) oxygenase [Gloeothece verrucosa PCC 7822]